MLTILLIEDWPGDVKLLKEALGSFEVRIDVSGRWEQAREYLLTHPTPSLIIADLHLPDAKVEEILQLLEPYKDRVQIFSLTDPPEGWNGVKKPIDWKAFQEVAKVFVRAAGG